LSNLADEVMAALHEAERLAAALPPGSTDHQTAADLAAELREICDQLNDAEVQTGVAGARQAVYAAQALLRVLASRHGQVQAGGKVGGGGPARPAS
jgi:hypothetical protein